MESSKKRKVLMGDTLIQIHNSAQSIEWAALAAAVATVISAIVRIIQIFKGEKNG